MFELLVNLMLTSLFLQSQADQQTIIDNISNQEYQLPQADVRQLQINAPQKEFNNESVGVEVSARSVLVADSKTGKVLYSKNPNEIRSIASITKLMTAMVFIDHNPGWKSEMEIIESDYRSGGIVYLISGEKISVYDIFHTALIASSNEAAVAMARSTGLTSDEFVKKMNEKAFELGMLNTTFTDVTGLNSTNKSTAADVVILIRSALLNNDIASAVGKAEHSIDIINKGIVRNIKSTDKILNQEFGIGDNIYWVEGGKTGYLETAGYCFASKVSDKNGKNVFFSFHTLYTDHLLK